MVALVGFAEHAEDVYNSLAVLADGQVQGDLPQDVPAELRGVRRAALLPGRRRPGGGRASTARRIGLTICEDIWEPGPPASDEALAGAEVIVNISASPYHRGKGAERERMLVQRARDNLAYVVFCNLVGGQDELVFDGYSLVVDQDGELVARGAQFEEELIVCDIDPSTARRARACATRATAPPRGCGARRSPTSAQLEAPARHDATEVGGPRAKPLELDEEVYAALCLGLRDYVDKNGFERVLLGLSGGIDSALTACVAVDALGSERVACAVMPSPHSSARDPERRAHASPTTSASSASSCALEPLMQRLRRGARRGRSRAPSRASPRRTSRPGSAATC